MQVAEALEVGRDIAGERPVPPEWLDANSDLAVAQPFADYVRPLVGPLCDYAIPLMEKKS